MIRRRPLLITLLAFLTLAGTILWWHLTNPARSRASSVTALFMLLTLGSVLMALLVVVIGAHARRRWLLIFFLAMNNLYWCLRWIQVFANSTPTDTHYSDWRHGVVRVMVLSSIALVLVYHLIDSLLRRRTHPPPPLPPA